MPRLLGASLPDTSSAGRLTVRPVLIEVNEQSAALVLHK